LPRPGNHAHRPGHEPCRGWAERGLGRAAHEPL
ncbi:MAG: hypothetical protein AVDCRST_MAG26-2831, partial [uncultured Chloroflexia bacterium]